MLFSITVIKLPLLIDQVSKMFFFLLSSLPGLQSKFYFDRCLKSVELNYYSYHLWNQLISQCFTVMISGQLHFEVLMNHTSNVRILVLNCFCYSVRKTCKICAYWVIVVQYGSVFHLCWRKLHCLKS